MLDPIKKDKLNQFLIVTDTSNGYMVGGELSQAIINHLSSRAFLAHVINLSWLSYDTEYKLSDVTETVAFFKENHEAIKQWLIRLGEAPASTRLILPSGYTNMSHWQDDGDLLDYLSDSLQKVARVNFDRHSIDMIVFKKDMSHHDAIFIADAMTKFLATVVGASYQNYLRKHHPVDIDKILLA